MEKDEIKIIDFNEMLLEKTFDWLTDPEIKKLTMTPDITRESQLQWYRSLNDRTDYVVKGVMLNTIPVGVVGLKNVDLHQKKAEYFGYIGEKNIWGHGVGSQMMQLIENLANEMGIKKMVLTVMEENVHAINLYKKQGYHICSNVEGLITMKKEIGD